MFVAAACKSVAKNCHSSIFRCWQSKQEQNRALNEDDVMSPSATALQYPLTPRKLTALKSAPQAVLESQSENGDVSGGAPHSASRIADAEVISNVFASHCNRLFCRMLATTKAS